MQKFANNARALLTGSITAAATSLTIEATKADRFPVANTPNWGAPADWFKAVLIDAAGNLEVVKVGQRSSGSNTFANILRGQDGTAALSFAAGSFALQTITAADVADVLAGNFQALNIAGALEIGQSFHCVGRAYTDVVSPAVHTNALVLDAAQGNVFELPVLIGNIDSMTIENAQPGQAIEVSVKQGGAGNYSVAVPAGAKIAGVVSTGVNRVSKLYLRLSKRDARFEGCWVPVPA